jgi:hypothetical protein
VVRVASTQARWNVGGLIRTFAAVADNHRRARQLSIIAAVAALHIAAVWVLLSATQPFAMRSLPQSLQLVFIAPTISAPERPARKWLPRSPRSLQPNPTPSTPVEPHPAPPGEVANPSHPPIDWAGELDRAVRDAAAAEASRKPLDFGFPQAPAGPSSKSPEFGWSYAPTHRVESMPGGGLLVNLNDNCVIVISPLPFFVCALGKKPANGDLFKHMHDP